MRPLSTEERAICVLIRAEAAPTASPLSRSATRHLTAWSAQGYPLVYCDLDGLRWEGHQLLATGWSPCLDTDAWQAVEAQPVVAVYNRYPLQRAPQKLHRLADEATARGIPMGNHPALQALVRDKWLTQEKMTAAGLAMPAAQPSPQAWHNSLHTWQRAYLKPRYGAFGEGILVLSQAPSEDAQQAIGSHSPDEAPDTIQNPHKGQSVLIEGPDKGQLRRCQAGQLLDVLTTDCGVEIDAEGASSHILQQAIDPPLSSLRGFSIRSLVQQTPQGQWCNQARVARCAIDDPVANVARRATPRPLEDICSDPDAPALSPALPGQLDQWDRRIAVALQQALHPLPDHAIVEFGVDYLVDPEGAIWLLEINGFPQGRLAALAAQDPGRFADKQRDALIQPLVTLIDAAGRSSFDI